MSYLVTGSSENAQGCQSVNIGGLTMPNGALEVFFVASRTDATPSPSTPARVNLAGASIIRARIPSEIPEVVPDKRAKRVTTLA